MMVRPALVWLTGYLLCVLVTVRGDDCPKTFPIKFQSMCYALQTDGQPFKDAMDMCGRLGGRMTSVKYQSELLKEIQDLIYKFVTSKLENAKFWIGLVMKDKSISKAKGDRLWQWEYDESEIVQKDYKMWEEEGGPQEAGLTCAAVDCANDFMVKPLDCGGSRLPVVCLMKEGKKCKHDVIPYFMYGKYCMAAPSYADAYGKVAPGCSPDAASLYLDGMKSSMKMAIKNSFLGGGVYMYMRKTGGMFMDLETGEPPQSDEWEEGEPRDEYECVGLSVQPDNSLKLKTIKCDWPTAYLCVHQGGGGDST